MHLSAFCFALMLSVAFAQTCLSAVNVARRREGIGIPMLYNDRLANAAKFHTDWMVANNCVSHQCPGEPSMVDRVYNTGYEFGGLGEVLAVTSEGCTHAVAMWVNWEENRSIVLGNYQNIGCHNVGMYYTCVFGVPPGFENKNLLD